MRSTVSILALLLAAAPCAHAEEEELIVTATRAPARAEALPAQIAVIDPQRARERGALTLDAALAEVPGLAAVRSGPVGQQASLFAGGAESNHTLVLFDGVRLNDPAAPEGLFDAGQDTLGAARRVEVVQGPMSALYGADALGGVVNILPRRGGAGAWNARLEAGAGSFGTAAATAGVDGTIGGLGYAVSADAFVSDGYDVLPQRVATHTGEDDGAESATLTGVFDLRVSETLSLDALVRRRQARADYDPSSFPPPSFAEQLTDDADAEIAESDSGLWRLGADWAANEQLTLRVAGGALDTKLVVADGGVSGDAFDGARKFWEASASWRTEAFDLVTGAAGERESIEAVQFGVPLRGEADRWGAYAVAHARFGALDLTAAARHDEYDGFGAKATWRAGASYALAPGMRVYAAAGSGYRAPSLYERFVFFGNPQLKPENAESWEAGVDGRFAWFGRDDGLQLGALFRHSDIEGLIAFDDGFRYANIDAAEIDLAEARAVLRPLAWLRARFSYVNTDARDAGSGAALRRRPRHAWLAALEAAHGPYSAELGWRETGARADLLYGDDGFSIGVGRAPSYAVARAALAWQASKAVRVYVAADNLFDDAYEPANGFAGAPRNVMAGVRVTP